ncbi:MAG: FixH family protein [Desulfurivibrionaceae bacterium]|nr:FixH family protein [Desulfobulbales bacterium]MDT8334740.1 FixH family protein [Desulfurivibrionaceae bacterium]
MSEQRKAGLWPWLVIVIGVSFLAISGWSVYRAVTGGSRVTDPAYYSHGLKYNRTRIEERAAEALGWQLSTAMTADRLLVRLASAGAGPVSGCRGELLIFTGAKRLTLALTEKEAGLYSVELPVSLTGSLTGDLTLQRDGARLSRRLLINL